MRKAWAWIKARPRWLWGVLVGIAFTIALAFKTSGGTPIVEERNTPIPPPPPPVPPILEAEAEVAKVEAERAQVAPSSMSAAEVAAGFERHVRKP